MDIPVSIDDLVEKNSESEPQQPPLTGDAYNQVREREGVRSKIALSLIALLSVVVIVPFVLILFGVGCDALDPGSDVCRRIPLVTLKDVLDTVLTPMVGLVGAVTGFYFGDSKSKG